MQKSAKQWLDSLVSMFFPQVCGVCGRSLVEGEKVLCSHCNLKMSRTNFHLSQNNELASRLVCHAPISRVASLYYYVREDPYSKLIHNLKYNHQRQIGIELAKMLAKEISPSAFFNGINLMLPVPMHWWKEIRRGYNQSRIIAEGIAEVTGIEIGDNLIATRSHATQTRKGSYGRWLNAEGIYAVKNADDLMNKHILVIDDVITTGSTIIHCCEAIADAVPSAKISVLSLATTRLG